MDTADRIASNSQEQHVDMLPETFEGLKYYVNRLRKMGKWYAFRGTIDGQSVEIKGYSTWLQIYRVAGIDYGNCMERKVLEFNEDLLAPFKGEDNV